MKKSVALVFVLALAFSAAGVAQDGGAQPPAGQNAAGQGGETGGGYGQRGGRGGFGGMGMMGRGVAGTVTEVASDHFTVKSFLGDTYTIQFGGSTRFVRMPAGTRRGEGQGNGEGSGQGSGESGGREPGQGWGRGAGNGGNPPQEIKPTDIKVGDVIEARGTVDATAKSVGATSVALVDPERAKQMQEMEANFGKTWLMGKVIGVDGVKVTLTGALDNAPHSFVADENTTFRRRRDPITLADIQVGDTVRAEGEVKGGVFTAASVGDMGAMQGENPRGAGPGAAPGSPQ
jgi:Domain of unknown function (DUF5666)